MDVVSLHRDQVIRACEIDSPIVMAVTSGTPRSNAIELSVGDGNTVGCCSTGDEHLASNEGDLAVVDPDEIAACNGNGVATPDVLWIEVGDVNVSIIVNGIETKS